MIENWDIVNVSRCLYHSVWVDECLVSPEAWTAVCLSICLMLKLLSSYDGHSTYPSFPSRALRSEKHTGAPQCRIRGEILYLSWTDRQTERHRWAKAQTQHEDDMMSALKASLTLGLDSVTDSSSISCSLPREIHGWDSGVFGTIMSSSSSSSTSSSSSPCTGDYKHNLYKKKLKSQNYPSIRPSIAHLQHVPFGLFCEHQIEALSVCEVSVKHQQKFIFRVLLQKNNSTEKNKTDLSGSEPSVNH